MLNDITVVSSTVQQEIIIQVEKQWEANQLGSEDRRFNEVQRARIIGYANELREEENTPLLTIVEILQLDAYLQAAYTVMELGG